MIHQIVPPELFLRIMRARFKEMGIDIESQQSDVEFLLGYLLNEGFDVLSTCFSRKRISL